MAGAIGAIWGIGGISLLLGAAIYRLTPLALEAVDHGLGAPHWAALAGFALFMAYAEGYRGFQQRFSPRAAARALYLRRNPTLLRVALAPFFCMGYFHATRRRKISSISLTLGIIALIALVRLLSQPWRGIIDFGVVVGLVWGEATVLYFSASAFFGTGFSHPPETPEAQREL
ncbi:MAG: hypothetical protein Kow0025_09320 [Thermodesulfovibrionales bacterium]